jgi:hypothetical protein
MARCAARDHQASRGDGTYQILPQGLDYQSTQSQGRSFLSIDFSDFHRSSTSTASADSDLADGIHHDSDCNTYGCRDFSERHPAKHRKTGKHNAHQADNVSVAGRYCNLAVLYDETNLLLNLLVGRCRRHGAYRVGDASASTMCLSISPTGSLVRSLGISAMM